jgi:tetratricopeptide (TPR) repeat protein
MSTTIFIILLIASCGYLLYVFFRHLPDLKNLDINSLPEEKQNEAKVKILQAKFTRNSDHFRKKARSIWVGQKNFLANKFSGFKLWVRELEEQYHLRGEQKPPESIQELIATAQELIKKEELVEAEKKLIAVIARERKNTLAYKLLGDLYFDRKDYRQAEEIFNYLLKLEMMKEKKAGHSTLSALKGARLEDLENDFLETLDIDPMIAVYYDDLGQIYELTDKDNKALDCYLKATAISPNNPKYLDKLTELSIRLGDKGLAKKTFNRLREINPENGKLADFKEALEKME